MVFLSILAVTLLPGVIIAWLQTRKDERNREALKRFLINFKRNIGRSS